MTRILKGDPVLTTTRRRQLLAVLLTPFLLLATGFRDTTNVTIESIDQLIVTINQGVDYGYASQEFDSVEQMCSEHLIGSDRFAEITVAPYEQDALWGCRFIGVGTPESYGLELSETAGGFLVVIGPFEMEPTERGRGPFGFTGWGEGDLRVSFTFPGHVIESTSGQIHGDTVTFSSWAGLSHGVEIRAEVEGDRADAGGFPWRIVMVGVLTVVLGVVLLLALAGARLLVVRARQGTGGDPGAGASAAAGAPAVARPAQPQAPQWGHGPPGQPDQPGQPREPEPPDGQQGWPQPPGSDGNQQPPPNPGW